jgi:2-dehydro-3-deoxyphosphogalactonate aldolase
MMNHDLDTLTHHPLVAILRGVQPNEVRTIAEVLVDAGFRAIEIPLNSPSPLQSIEILARAFDDTVLVGAGTVLSVSDVDLSADAGARLLLSPNQKEEVIRHTVSRGLVSMPGVATPTEAFAALAAGANLLKLFPADILGPSSFKAWRAVLPNKTGLFGVGGIDASNLAAFKSAGATGVGLGSWLYKPGISLVELAQRAIQLQKAWNSDVQFTSVK